MKEVEDYLAALPKDQRTTVNDVRRIVREIVPDAVEDLGYGMPRFKYRAKPLIAVAAWKAHMSLYGGWDAIGRHDLEGAGFEINRSTIQLRWGRPLPKAMVADIVRSRMANIDAAAGVRRSKKA